MNKLLATLAIFFIFLGCGFKPIYKITSDDTSIASYSVEVTNQVAREIIEEVNSTIVPGENQKYKALLNIYEDLTPLIVNTNFEFFINSVCFISVGHSTIFGILISSL